jgi:cytochrome c oxidase subunit 3
MAAARRFAPGNRNDPQTVATRRPPPSARSVAAVHNPLVTTATTPAATPPISARIHTLNRPNMVSVGTIVWLSSELMFFAGLFGIYFTARATNVGEWPPPPTELDIPYALVFTVILVASSFTCQFGVWAAERGDVFALRRWYFLSFLMGLTFVLGQANEYRNLVDNQGTTISSSAFGTVFFLATGFHGLHVIGGLIAFLLLIARTKLSKFTPAQATSAIVVSYYWHFVDVVWVALFSVIYLLR